MTCLPTDRLMQSLRVHVPGVTDPLLQLEIFNVLDEFFRRTNAWLFQDSMQLEIDKHEYAFAIPADSIVVRLMSVSHNQMAVPAATTSLTVTQSSLGRLVPELVFPDGDSRYVPAVSDLAANNLFTYAIYKPEYIQTTGEITDEMTKYPLVSTLALSLSRNCLECDCGDWALPDWMYDMFFQDWLDGCLSRLYGMPAKPWSSPTIAAYHARRFRNRMAFRKQEAVRGYDYSVPGWRFPAGGWT